MESWYLDEKIFETSKKHYGIRFNDLSTSRSIMICGSWLKELNHINTTAAELRVGILTGNDKWKRRCKLTLPGGKLPLQRLSMIGQRWMEKSVNLPPSDFGTWGRVHDSQNQQYYTSTIPRKIPNHLKNNILGHLNILEIIFFESLGEDGHRKS